jgi:tRNA(adenine34) deaminase
MTYHEQFMRIALEQAGRAFASGEVPVGAVVVRDRRVIAVGHNQNELLHDPTAHAEILALRTAAKKIDNYRLLDCTLYATIEPCAMCAGALVNARIKRLVYGTRDERFGAVDTHFGICTSPELNHRIEVTRGVLVDECRQLIQDFFKAKRAS